MRRNATPAETELWRRLRRAQPGGLSFRRQHPIDRFLVDFYCADAKLVIEVDGPIHLGLQRRDADRDRTLQAMGCTILRFSNDEVLQDVESVLQRIRAQLEG